MDLLTTWVATAWGVLTMTGTVIVFSRRYWQWRRHRDARSIRALLIGIAILLVAAASLASMLTVVFVIGDIGTRRFFAAIAWGAFSALVALLVLWTPSDG
jgi:integral membrane sensor domain MASE1